MDIEVYGLRLKKKIKKFLNQNSKVFLLTFELFLFCLLCSAQQKAIQYDKNFEFKNGLYISFLDFKNNNPVITSQLISDYNKNSREFFDKILSKSTFTYIDSADKEQTLKTDDLWGYCVNGIIYINHGTDFNRVTIIGSICHFVATVPMKVGMSDPFNYNDPFYNPPQYTYVSEQFVLDYESGKVLEFNSDNMEALLSRDGALYKEFTALKKKKKRDSIFLYMRKYNEKHPIYFPE